MRLQEIRPQYEVGYKLQISHHINNATILNIMVKYLLISFLLNSFKIFYIFLKFFILSLDLIHQQVL